MFRIRAVSRSPLWWSPGASSTLEGVGGVWDTQTFQVRVDLLPIAGERPPDVDLRG